MDSSGEELNCIYFLLSMPSLTDLLYCFRNIDDYKELLAKFSTWEIDESFPRFENIVLSLDSMMYDPSWKQWKDIAITLKNYPFLKALEAYEVNGEPPIEGDINNLIRIDCATRIPRATVAEWAWALGSSKRGITFFASQYDIDNSLFYYMDGIYWSKRTINRAYFRLGESIPFPLIKN